MPIGALLAYLPEFVLLQNAAWFQPILSSARIVLASNDTAALVAGARAGLGVAVLPRVAARSCDDLIAVSADVGGSEHWLVTHPEFRRDPRVRVVADFLKRIAAGPAGIG